MWLAAVASLIFSSAFTIYKHESDTQGPNLTSNAVDGTAYVASAFFLRYQIKKVHKTLPGNIIIAIHVGNFICQELIEIMIVYFDFRSNKLQY